MRILIGMPSYSGMIPSLTVMGLLRLEHPHPIGFMTVTRQRIDIARNIIAEEVLDKGWDYLLFIDDDNPVPSDTIIKFLEDDKDIVTAPILGRRSDGEGNHTLCAFYGKYYDGVRFYFPIKEFRDEGYLHKVDNSGMGCVLIKRKVLEGVLQKHRDYIFGFGDIRFAQPINVEGHSYAGRTMSEDMEFCERAVDAGFEIWLDARIRPLHLMGTTSLQWKPNVNTASYWDDVWTREGEDTWRKYPLTFQKVASRISSDDAVLDVGCGVGVLLDVLKPLCREVAGLDISPIAIEVLKSKGIQGKVGVLPTIDFPDKSFDVVVATETIEHLDDPSSLIKEMIRVARKKVILSVPDGVLGPQDEKEHRQLFTKSSFTELLSRYFERVEMESFTDVFKTPTTNISLPTLLAVCEVEKTREGIK